MKKHKGGVGIEDLPEECLANIISLTSPVDACRLALVSSTFRSAADSDHVWESFLLPSGYKSMIDHHSNASMSSSKFSSTKELFFKLCHNPVLIEHAKKSFWLDKWSGKKCYMIAAKELRITLGNNPENSIWTDLPDSRFTEVAELLLVWILEIYGKIDTAMLSPATKYAAYLVLKWQTNAHGFNWHPTRVSMGVSGTKTMTSTVCMAPDREPRGHFGIPRCSAMVDLRGFLELQRPRKRRDGWLEIELGEYFNDSGEEGELEMSVVEITAAKAGLIVQGIEIRPKSG